MQERAWEHWRKMAKHKREPEPLEDFGWHNPEPYALEIGHTFAEYRILPEPGGWNNQYEADKHDISTYMHGMGICMYEEYGDDDKPTGTVEPGEYPDWAEYTR